MRLMFAGEKSFTRTYYKEKLNCRRRLVKSFIYLSLLLLSSSAKAEIGFEHLTVSNGLPTNSVTAITKDSEGFMWFGTQEGLCRYDSKVVKVYKKDPMNYKSISSNLITCLYTDSKNNLWVGTTKGLNLYQSDSDSFVKIRPVRSTPHDEIILDLYEDKDGIIWIASLGSLRSYNPQTGRFSYYVNSRNKSSRLFNSVVKIKGTSKGEICLLNGKRLISLHRKSNFYVSNVISLGNADSFYSQIVVDKKDEIWLESKEGLSRLDLRSKKLVPINYSGQYFDMNRNGSISLICSKSGMFWRGGNQGLHHYDPRNNKWVSYIHDRNKPQSLARNRVISLYEDNSGFIWVGTLAGGVDRISTLPEPFQFIESGKNDNIEQVNAMTEDSQGNLLLGTGAGKLIYYNQNSNQFNMTNAFNSQISGVNIQGLLVDQEGIIWIGTNDAGFYQFDSFKNTLENHSIPVSNKQKQNAKIRCLYKDSFGRFWIELTAESIYSIN